MASPEDLDETVNLVEKTGPPHRRRTGRRPRLRATQGRGGQRRGRIRPSRLRARQCGDPARGRRGPQRCGLLRRRGRRDAQRRPLHDRGGVAAPGRARRRRRHRDHQFDSGTQRVVPTVQPANHGLGRLPGGQTRRHRTDAILRISIGGEEHSRQYRASHRRRHADVATTITSSSSSANTPRPYPLCRTCCRSR